MTTRRSFLASILAAGVAPAFAGSGVLMPVKKIVVPQVLIVEDSRSSDDVLPVRDWVMPNHGSVWVEATSAAQLAALTAHGGLHLRSTRTPRELYDCGKGIRITEAERTLLTIHSALRARPTIFDKPAVSFDFTQPPVVTSPRVLHFNTRLSNELLKDLTA